MEWKDYLGELSRRLAVGNSPGETLDILRELDDFHQAAAEGGTTDADFIAKLGAPELAARNLSRDRGTEKAPADWRFWLGVTLMAFLFVVLRNHVFLGLFLYDSGPVWTAITVCVLLLTPAALWWCFRMDWQTTALAFAEERRNGYWEIVGFALVVLVLGYVLGADYWQTTWFQRAPTRFGDIFSLFSAAIGVLAVVELVRAAWAIYRCRPGGFPACCFWLGLLCTRMLIELPLRSMDMDTWQEGLIVTEMLFLSELPAMLALVLTVGITLLARSLLRKKAEEVRKSWTHN